MAKQAIAHIDGISTTGAAHGVLIELPKGDASGSVVALTITGADGKKRHATSVLCGDQIDALIAGLQLARKGAQA